MTPHAPTVSSRGLLALVLLSACLAGLFAVACERAPQTAAPPPSAAPRRTADLDMPALDTADEFAAKLRAIPPGRLVLAAPAVEHQLPPTVEKAYWHDRLSIYWPWLLPDDRRNPAEAEYVLAPNQLDLRAMLWGAPPIWRLAGAVADPGSVPTLLLQRVKPLAEQLAAPLTDAAFRESLRETVTIAWTGAERAKLPEAAARAFAIDRYEVTHAQFAHFLNDVAMPYEQAIAFYDIKDPSSRIVYVDGRYRTYRGAQRLPVYAVTWYGANAFCDRYGRRLPRQLDWQKASGFLDDGRLYPWGRDTDFARRANLNQQDDGYPFWAPVDSMPAGISPYGLYHMAGNVAEWIEAYKVVGSAFQLGAREARNDFRDANHALARNLHDGFRCVADVKEP